MTRNCKSCNNCKIVYRYIAYEYRIVSRHYCTACKKMTELNGGCGKWEAKRLEYDLSAARFDKAEEDIKAIAKMLKCEIGGK